MTMTKTTQLPTKPQADKFRELARELETDDDDRGSMSD